MLIMPHKNTQYSGAFYHIFLSSEVVASVLVALFECVNLMLLIGRFFTS